MCRGRRNLLYGEIFFFFASYICSYAQGVRLESRVLTLNYCSGSGRQMERVMPFDLNEDRIGFLEMGNLSYVERT